MLHLRSFLSVALVTSTFYGCPDSSDVKASDASVADSSVSDDSMHDGGAPLAYVSFNVPPDSECYVDAKSTKFIGIGIYDIAGSVAGGDSTCAIAYTTNLVLVTEPPSEGDSGTTGSDTKPIIRSERVRLMTLDKEVITFDGPNGALPNPYVVRADVTAAPQAPGEPIRHVLSSSTIPPAYGALLEKYVGEQILLEVTVEGEAPAIGEFTAKPFVFPLEICKACLTVCSSKLVEDMRTPNDVHGDQCADNAGADGRICIDSDC
jgi:hypothetical protein